MPDPETSPSDVIHRFYTAFQQRDYRGMNACYADDIVFYDPVFGPLQAAQVKKMWEMLCKRANDLVIEFGNIKDLGEDYYTCDWKATYTFSKTGRKVVNNIKAHMRFSGNKITEHSDAFSVHKWSTQALGFSGWLLGWNSMFQRKISHNAHKQLIRFMQQKV